MRNQSAGQDRGEEELPGLESISNPLPGPGRKSSSRLWSLAKMLAALLLAGLVISRTSLRDLSGLWERISLPWLAFGTVLFLLISVLKALQYYILFGRRVDYPAVLNIVIMQNAISNFIAAGAGIVSYLTMFAAEKGIKVRRVAMVFILSKLGDLAAIWLFLFVSSLSVWGRAQPLQAPVILLLVLIAGVLLTFIVTVLWRQRFVALIAVVMNRLGLSRLALIQKGLESLGLLAGQEQGFVFRMIGLGVLYSTFYQSLTLLWAYATLETFGMHLSLMGVVFTNALTQVISYLPIQAFGGLGVTESASLYLYGFFGPPQAQIASVLIGGRILFYLLNLLALLYLPLYTWRAAIAARAEKGQPAR